MKQGTTFSIRDNYVSFNQKNSTLLQMVNMIKEILLKVYVAIDYTILKMIMKQSNGIICGILVPHAYITQNVPKPMANVNMKSCGNSQLVVC